MKTKAIRLSLSLPEAMMERINSIAAARSVTARRVIVDLLADAIAACERERSPCEPTEAERLRSQLARMTPPGG